MASKSSTQLLSTARQFSFCPGCLSSIPRQATRRSRAFSTARILSSEVEVQRQSKPRWAQTPPAMKAPIPSRAKAADRKPIPVNDSPQKLDQVYARFFESDQLALSDETKWLAVTHKSFDFGRRGYNDRLAFFGKRILALQTSLALLQIPSEAYLKGNKDPWGRTPFEHEDLKGLETLGGRGKDFLLHHKQICKVAESYGLQDVVRWAPKDPSDLLGSGYSMVMAQSVFAIIGALAHEQGKEVADTIARERVLQKVRSLPRDQL